MEKTQSICPVCHRPVEAVYTEGNGRMYFEKKCPEHGLFRSLAAESAEDYLQWVQSPVINIPPRKAQTMGAPDDAACPLHCGTCDNHLQTACCVLIDITDRCNQHCPYCFAGADMDGDADRSSEPSMEELDAKFELLLELGEEHPFNIQLSGGEPTIRDDLPEIISMARQKGFNYIQINTNGRRLALEDGYARVLKEAGASVIFMQFDGTRDEIYEALRGEPLMEIKKKAIRNCEKAGLPVTLVPTVVAGVNSDNIGEMMDFLIENVNVVKGIHFQPVSFFGRHPEDFEGRITMFGLLRKLEQQSPQFKYEDFCPISTGHTLCCFYSTYIKEPDGSIRCTLTNAQKQAGIACCDTSGFTKNDCLEIIKKDRDFVFNRWEIVPPEETDDGASGHESGTDAAPKYTSSKDIISMEDFLRYFRRNTFTVTGMAFQDIFNIDAQRVKRCRVQQLADDGRLIPFCAYNSIYRGNL